MIGKLRISGEALANNARVLQRLVAPAKAAFVVKSNGYGHGLLESARAFEPFADRLCVYSIEEGLALRDAGLSGRIFTMGPIDPKALDDAVARGIELALWDTTGYLSAVSAAARKRSLHAKVHVKINTGVARLGLEPPAARDAVERFTRQQDLELTGIFSHLAAAEELDSPFTMRQLETFLRAVSAIEPVLSAANAHPLRHIAASAAAMLWPQTRLDFARFGIAAYGLWPSKQTRIAMDGADCDLRAALSFTSQLVAVRDVSAGTPVGYGGTYHAATDTRIGVVPVGYADGIPRLLSNRGSFVVAGARCPIVGRVCMNMTMVDLGAVPAARPGTAVTLIGSDGAAEVTVEDWAGWAETINYEIVARLPEHLPRELR